jgi:hypothetical protein
VQPGETAEHTETWTLADEVDGPRDAFEIEPASVR